MILLLLIIITITKIRRRPEQAHISTATKILLHKILPQMASP